jgi:hypothetical protein
MPKTDCDAHGWNFEPDDTCPVCDGIELERERIIALLWDWGVENLDCQSQYEDLVGLIEAEDSTPPPGLPPELQAALDRITIRK